MVSPEKQIWKCFGCGKGGDHYKFIMETESLEFGDALKLLAQKAGVTLQPKTRSEYQTHDRKEVLYSINSLSSRVFHKILLEQPAASDALLYLKKRKLSEETIKKFSVGFAPRKFDLRSFLIGKGFLTLDVNKAGSPDKFFDRVIFPISDVLGNVIAFTARSLGDAQPKYLNSPETPLFNKSRTLYGLNLAKSAIKEKNYVVLVEGQMDVLSLHQNNVAQAVASSGTAITETQIQILSKYTTNFLLAFDNDDAGRNTTKKVIEMLLKLDLNAKVVNFGSYKDAGELFENRPADWVTLAKEAPEALDWWINQEISAAGDMQFIENKKKVVKSMLPIISLVVEPTRLDHYAQRLSLAIGVKTESVYAALEKQAAPVPKSVNKNREQVQNLSLTNEELLLAVIMARPEVAAIYAEKFENVSWQSEDAARIALEVKKLYTNKTLTKNQSQFLSEVKNSLNSQTAGKIASTLENSPPSLSSKIDSWQFYLSASWGELNDELARQLIEEKLLTLSTKDYERSKERLAADIKRAQEKGDINRVKKLMSDLSELAKERTTNG